MSAKDKIKTPKKRVGLKAKFVPRPPEDPKVIEARWQKKKDQIHQLANDISRLRLNVSNDLKNPQDEKTFLTALIIAVMDKTGERIGNNESASEGHHGVSGFLKKHITIKGKEITLKYKGKSGVDHEKVFKSEKVAEALKKAIKTSPDKRVFTTSEGQWIGADQVNRYLQNFSVTAKALRGFYVNKAITEKLQSMEIPETDKKRKTLFNSVCKKVASNVGHGTGTCKKHYIVPELPEQYINHGKIIDLKTQTYYKSGGRIKKDEKVSEKEISDKKSKVLLAPNGKPSNLNEVQWKLVRTPEFKKWFGDWENNPENASKVIDENGEPLVVYHGTHGNFTIFDESQKSPLADRGFFFSDNYEVAKLYGRNILPSFLKINDPNVLNASNKTYNQVKALNDFQVAFRGIGKFGNDGLIIKNIFDHPEGYKKGRKSTIYAIDDPTQIKLADGRNVSFDSNSADIRYKKGGPLGGNEKFSNLNSEQYKLVRTPEFKKWFGDWENDPKNASKIVDENGEPLVVYHGSDFKINAFDVKKQKEGFHGRGFYFATNDLEYGKNVYSVFLNVRQPFDVNSYFSLDEIKSILGEKYAEIESTLNEELEYSNERRIGGFVFYSLAGNKNLQEAGYDGIIHSNIRVAFYPNQIKLADGSNITFDPNSPDIRMAKGGSIPQRYKEIGFSYVGQKKRSTRPNKKWMVLAKKGDKYKIVHGGEKGMEDFSQHKDKKRQRRFWDRMGGFDSEKTKDPFSPLYWHKKFGTWENGGVLEDGTIKVVWVNKADPETFESKMFNNLEDAVKYGEGKTHLIMQLQDNNDNYYRWKLLPYGEYERYKSVIKWVNTFDDFSNKLFGNNSTDAIFSDGGNIETDSFKKWFKGSKVVDKDGNPIKVYHGTGSKFNKFNIKKTTQGIIWFTSDKEAIEKGEVGAQGKGYIMDLYASIQNPAGWKEYDKYYLNQLQQEGYDGAILPDKNGHFVGFVFNPSQLKSATNNKGTYDINNPDLRYKSGGKVINFTSYEDANKWIEEEAKKYGSKNEFYSTSQYKEAYPLIKELWNLENNKFISMIQEAMKESGVNFGDEVFYDNINPFGYIEEYSGRIINRNGIPMVKLHNGQQTISGSTVVRWHKGWRLKRFSQGGNISPSVQPIWTTKTPIMSYNKLTKEYYTDVVIVGAGIAGLTTAYLLLKKGYSVIVLDKGEIGSGETLKTTAHLSWTLDKTFEELSKIHGEENSKLALQSHLDAIREIEKISKDENINNDFKHVNGYSYSPIKKDLVDQFEYLSSKGFSNVEYLDKTPLYSFESGHALKYEDQARFDPAKYIEGLSKAITSNGGLIFTNTDIVKFEGGKNAYVQDSNGHKVYGKNIVVSTNTPVNNLVTLQLRQAPYRTYAIAVPLKGEVDKTLQDGLYWDNEDPYHYIRLEYLNGEPFLIVGGEDHRVGQEKNTEKLFGELERWTQNRFPVGPIKYKWSGQILESNDGLAFIGKNPADYDNVYVATGFSGNGITYGTLTGMILSDLISGKKNKYEEVYSPSRIRPASFGTFVKEAYNTNKPYVDWLLSDDTKSISAGEGKIIDKGFKKLAVYKDRDNKLHACDATCTHMGCVVRWNTGEKTWDCPCHGSRFDTKGEVLNGPAILPLKKIYDIEDFKYGGKIREREKQAKELKERGGLVVGPRHTEGGVPFVIEDTGQPIEEEGLEVNIPGEVSEDKNIYTFTGQNHEVIEQILKKYNLSLSNKVTNVRAGDIVICIKSVWDPTIRTYTGTLIGILSEINTSNGCKFISEGATIKEEINANGNPKMHHGGRIMARELNAMHPIRRREYFARKGSS